MLSNWKLKDLERSTNLDLDFNTSSSASIFTTNKLAFSYKDTRNYGWFKSLVKKDVNKDEHLILSLQDISNPPIIYGEVSNLVVSGLDPNHAKPYKEIIEAKKVHIPPHTIIVDKNNHLTNLEYPLWAKGNVTNKFAYSDTNIIINSDVQEYTVQDSKAGGGCYRIGFFNHQLELDEENLEQSCTLILYGFEKTLALKYYNVLNLNLEKSVALIKELNTIICHMLNYYIQDMELDKSSDDYNLLVESLELTNLRIMHYLSAISKSFIFKYENRNYYLMLKTQQVIFQFNRQEDNSAYPSAIKEEGNYSFFNDIIEIIDDYDSYSVDLVKMMSAPSMLNLEINEISMLDNICEDFKIRLKMKENFTKEDYLSIKQAHKKALRLSETNKLSLLEKDKQDKIKDAQQMLTKAMHEGTSEHEKRASIKGMINKLEGVIPVNSESIQWLHNTTGLTELTK